MFIFWKQISLALQIVIIVAAVLVFCFFDPFGLLKSKKLNLENTPINVTSIREIGQLITAEYYGEVLNSLQQSRINQVIEENVDFEAEYNSIHDQFRNSINELVEDKEIVRLTGWNKKQDLYDYFYYRYSTLTSNPYYQDYIFWLIERLKAKDERRLLKSLYANKGDMLSDLNKLSFDKELTQEIKKITDNRLTVLTANRKFRKQQIVVLGRGWVKAGIDFGQFTQQNFKYDKATKTIYLIGLKPQILSCTINPWFIPEKQVKGFEVILVSNKANQPKYMQIVKTETLKKLRNNALEANILEQAKRNAETNLKDFFSLLIDGGVDNVIIYDDFFSYFDVSLSTELLSPGSIKSIDSLFVKRYYTDSLEVIQMRDTLQRNRSVVMNDKSFNVQRYSALLSLIEDEELTTSELNQLETVLHEIQSDLKYLQNDVQSIRTNQLHINTLDSIWFFPDANTLKVIDQIVTADERLKLEKQFSTFQVISGSEEYEAWEAKKISIYHQLIYRHISDQKMKSYEEIVSQIKGNVVQLVLNDATIMDAKVYKDNGDVRISGESQKISFDNDIPRRINEILLPSNLEPVDSAKFIDIELSLDTILSKYGIDSISNYRTKIQQQYVACNDQDCNPVSRFTLYQISEPSVNSMGLQVSKEIDEMMLHTMMSIDSLDSISFNKVYLDHQDSLWYFPASFELNVFKVKQDELYPKGGMGGFFRKTFSGKKHEAWLSERSNYYANQVYKLMLLKKLEELKQIKTANLVLNN